MIYMRIRYMKIDISKNTYWYTDIVQRYRSDIIFGRYNEEFDIKNIEYLISSKIGWLDPVFLRELTVLN